MAVPNDSDDDGHRDSVSLPALPLPVKCWAFKSWLLGFILNYSWWQGPFEGGAPHGALASPGRPAGGGSVTVTGTVPGTRTRAVRVPLWQ